MAVAVNMGVGLASGMVTLVLAIPLVVIGLASGNWTWAIILAIVVLVPVMMVVSGFVNAQGSTYWTLAFRRLELEPSPSATTETWRPMPMTPEAMPQAN